MTVNEFLRLNIKRLEAADVPSARLDCLVLLEDALDKDRGYLLAHPELALHNKQLKKLDSQIERRAQHEPLAFVRGKTEFYGREFYVNKRVLEPRPESETMIDLLKNLISKNRPWKTWKIADVGTGSGALAITAKLEIPDAEVVATDIDPACLKVARKNSKKLGAAVKFLQGDLLEPVVPLPTAHYILLCNLPYVPDNFTINQAAMNEPRQAIFGGSDGLDLYRRLFAHIERLPQKPQCILTESLPFQHEKLAEISQTAGYGLQTSQDFIQVFAPKS